MQDNKEKLCLCFSETTEILVLNQTNLGIMIDAGGEESKGWVGAVIRLSLIPSTFNGKKVRSVLISEVKLSEVKLSEV